MAKYQLLQIVKGEETVLLDTKSKRLIKKKWNRDGMFRIRIDGEILLIFEAELFVAGKLKKRKVVVKPAVKKAPPAILDSRKKAVLLIDKNGNVVRRYPTVTAAAEANGYYSRSAVALSCNTGNPTKAGLRFKWEKEES